MLRISLLRHLREKKKVSGSSGKKKKPFYLEDAMKYLIPYTKSRHQTGNAESDEDAVCDNHSQMEDSQTYGNEEESVDSSNIQNNDIEEEVNEIGTSHLLERTLSSVATDLPKKIPQGFSSKKRKIESTQNWENSAVKCLNALSNKYNVNIEKKELSVEEDADLLFLKSLLPDLKKLNDAQKRQFKKRIFVLYDDILNEDCTRSTVQIPLQSPYSSAVSVSSYDSNIQYSTDNGKQYADLVNSAVFQ